MTLTIIGGHVISPASYEAGIRQELAEELSLPSEPAGRLIELGVHTWQRANDLNVENRKLWLYELSFQEDKHVCRVASDLEKTKASRTQSEFRTLLEQWQHTAGQGEVWGMHAIDANELSVVPLAISDEFAGFGELPFIVVTDKFRDGDVQQMAFFSPDLLAPLITGPMLMRITNGISRLKEGS
jgi:hypothetical protein